MDEEKGKAQCLDFWPTEKKMALLTLEFLVCGMVHKLSYGNEYWRKKWLEVVHNADRITLWLYGTTGCDQLWHELTNLCTYAHECGVLKAVSGELEFRPTSSGQESIAAGPGYHLERLVRKRVAQWGDDVAVQLDEALETEAPVLPDNGLKLGVVQKVWEHCNECPNMRVACASDTPCPSCILSTEFDPPPAGCPTLKQCKLDNRPCDHSCDGHKLFAAKLEAGDQV